MSQVLMEFQEISKSFRTGVRGIKHQVLSGCNLTISEDESVGLMGPSGSGKTTIGMIIAGLERPDSGIVKFCGRGIYSGNNESWRSYRRAVQMLFQDPQGAFHPMRMIGKSMRQVMDLYGYPAIDHEKRIKEIISKTGLNIEVLSRYPDQISGGQAQRLALARILLIEPKVIILDEPTSGLDISIQAQILNLLKEVQKSCHIAYLLISHDPDVIRFMCRRYYRIQDGKLITGE
jgi:peptide/nickel transport system ATP-binding protein